MIQNLALCDFGFVGGGVNGSNNININVSGIGDQTNCASERAIKAAQVLEVISNKLAEKALIVYTVGGLCCVLPSSLTTRIILGGVNCFTVGLMMAPSVFMNHAAQIADNVWFKRATGVRV